MKPLSAIPNRNSQYASQFSEIFPCPMTRFLFDQFAKNYLKELLSPIGEVKTSDEVRAEVRQIDVRFTPTATAVSSSWIQQLGLLGRMVTQTALFEPFRNPATVSEIRGCVTKLFNVCADLERVAKREGTKMEAEDYPMLWVLTPTLSQAQLDAVKLEGVEEGIERGVEQGIQRGQRLIMENLLRVRFGELDARMPILIESISTLSPEAFTLFLLQLSAANNNEVGLQLLPRLFVEELLKFRWGDALEGEDRESPIQAILALSEEALAEVLVLLKSGSREEVMGRLMG